MLSKHHYALELARRGNEVLFIEPPTSEGANMREVSSESNVTALSWKGLRGLARLPHPLSKVLQAQEWKQIIRLYGKQPDVLWSFDNSRLFDLGAAPHCRRRIHHLVDLNQDFQVKRCAESADLCLATTRFIAAELEKHNPNTHDIGHACIPVPEALVSRGNLRRKQAYYSGNLLIPLLDRERILRAVDHRPDADFHFLGAYGISNLSAQIDQAANDFISALRSRKNCTLHGPLKGETYQTELGKADVFIAAYRPDAYNQVANPHKIPELLSTGAPIVANVLDAYQGSELLYMADDLETWLALLDDCLDKEEAPQKGEARRRFALQRSYSQQVNLIEELLQ